MKLSKKAIAKFQAKELRVREGHFANNVEAEGYVRDRKTGEYYKPAEAFDRLMMNRETQAMLRRLAGR
jgi:hypothetical protein